MNITIHTDWLPEAGAAIAACAGSSSTTCNAPSCNRRPGHMGANPGLMHAAAHAFGINHGHTHEWSDGSTR